MFQLCCPVRNCTSHLEPRKTGLACGFGHHFDRAREGYWSLIQPQDRKSVKAGDSDAAVLARHRWLTSGHANQLMRFLSPLADAAASNTGSEHPRIVDLGCGEGSFGPALFNEFADSFCGIDLSKRALRFAARGWAGATWVLANADRTLPIADTSVDCVVSLFGRRPASEISRIAKPGARCIIAVPAEDDLIELREKTQKTGHRRNRCRTIIDEFSSTNLQFREHKTWRQQMQLDEDGIKDALAMTYRAVRHSQQARLGSVTSIQVTLAADILLFERAC